jgi:hypothetical protein
MLIKVIRSGGFTGYLNDREVLSQQLDDRWTKFVETTGFFKIPRGKILQNFTDIREVTGRDMYTYTVQADGRTIYYNSGTSKFLRNEEDPRFIEVMHFVDYVLGGYDHIDINK